MFLFIIFINLVFAIASSVNTEYGPNPNPLLTSGCGALTMCSYMG